MKEDNQTIIKALNMYGRVPEMWELLNEIERLNNIINELEKWLEDMSNRTTLHISTITGFTMCLNKLQELKGSDKECM